MRDVRVLIVFSEKGKTEFSKSQIFDHDEFRIEFDGMLYPNEVSLVNAVTEMVTARRRGSLRKRADKDQPAD